MHPEDVAIGMKRRTVRLIAQKPEHHTVEILSGSHREVRNLPSLLCDHCNNPISNGADALAVTWWNENREPEPRNWEIEYE
jgi:hypothetical protein